MLALLRSLRGELHLSALRRGILDGVGSAAIAAGAIAVSAIFWAVPPADVFASLAQVGATLLVAFAIEVSWLAQVSPRRGSAREFWVGSVSGAGVSALIGIIVAIALQAHVRAGHSNWIDKLGLAWSLGSLLLIGVMVAVQPLTHYEWRRAVEPLDDD